MNSRELASRKAAAAALAAIGQRIRRLRETKGLSRTDLARTIKVDVSSISGWESGKRLPRDAVRARLARTLGCELSVLMSPKPEADVPSSVTLMDVAADFPKIFADCARNLRHTFRAIRLALPSPTPLHFQAEGRQIICDRLSGGTLEVQRAEIFYSLDRLKEVLSNILRYDGRAYYVKAYCIGLSEIAPTFGGFSFDDTDFVLGGYWTSNPPAGFPLLRLRGPAIRTFFLGYWKETWSRGTLLNVRGSRDLSNVREVALKMGLPARQWPGFVEQARALEIGDGSPPII